MGLSKPANANITDRQKGRTADNILKTDESMLVSSFLAHIKIVLYRKPDASSLPAFQILTISRNLIKVRHS